MELPIRPGQRYRNVRTDVPQAEIISVDAVEGNTVQGAAAPEQAPPGTVAAGAWSVDEVRAMLLVHDPEWPVHRVTVALS